MMAIDHRVLFVAGPLLILGCSGADDGNRAGQASENVFSEQTRAVGKAAEVNQLIQDTAARQRQAIDRQSD